MPTLPTGAVIRSRASVFGDRVFYVTHGRRHWIRDGRWFAQYGVDWPDGVLEVDASVLLSFLPGGPAPLAWTAADVAAPPIGCRSADLREIATHGLQGSGIEFGAGTSPSPVPLDTRVLFADRLERKDLVSELYPGQLREDLIDPDLESDLETFAGIPDESLDFVLACHVIEHTRSPIRAVVEAWRRLRPRGKLVLVVPDMERTFDRDRALTTVEHLVDDYRNPTRERDRQHYEEFYRLAFKIPETALAATVDEKFRDGYAIHYHVWSYRSFGEMVDWTRHEAPWREVWSHPAGQDSATDNEFYFVLTK